MISFVEVTYNALKFTFISRCWGKDHLGDLREKLSQTQEKKGTILMVYKFGENDTSLKKLC